VWCRVIGVTAAQWAASAADVFAAIGTTESLAALRAALAATVVEFGIVDLDAAAIRLSLPRGFIQAVSRYVYDLGTFDSVCYCSRYGDDIKILADFEPLTAIRCSARQSGGNDW
jgi:hypothetical protein